MQREVGLSAAMLAPCGIPCDLCYAHLREKSACPGCRAPASGKPKHCLTCAIANCAAGRGVDLCGSCEDFPCKRLKLLDKRYRQSYGVGLIEGAVRLKAAGVEAYLREERERWTCPSCGGLVCLHTRLCSACGGRERYLPRRIAKQGE